MGMGMGGGWFFWLAILLVIGVGFYYGFLPRRGVIRRDDDALHIARMRFARGEITVEEFEDIKKSLQ